MTGQILESATVLKEVGAAFLLAPNAREIIQSWGIDPELVGATKLDGLQIWDSDGRAAKDVKFGDFNGVDVVSSDERALGRN